MKPPVPYAVSFVLLLSVSVAASQEKNASVGAYGSIFAPTGSLSKRFVAAPGASVFFFVNRGVPQWGAAVEYLKLTKRVDNLSVNRPITDTANGVPQKTFYQLPIPKTAMSLEVFGASVQTRYELVRFGDFLVHIGFGAGIYRWTFNRNEYRDSLRVQTPRGERTAAILNVPALKQQDWSGGLNGGAHISVKVFDPLWLNAGARFKLIIGELWPTVALDLENVSTFQMLDFCAGLSVDF